MGPGDDAAVLADGTAVTVDALVEGVHWDERLSPEDVGYKAVAASVSDLGAMGARPRFMVLAASLSAGSAEPAWLDALSRGLGQAAARYDVALIGGDVTRTPGPTVLSITMGGPCVASPLLRSTARPGDAIWVTGTLGLAGAGWLLADPPAAALSALRRPDPPLSFALALAEAGAATAMMDLSDGLASDLPRLCRASGVGARISPDALPLHPALAGVADPVALAVGAGEDYQLLFCARSDATLAELAARYGVALTRIGTIEAGDEVALVGRPWPPPAFTHFAATGAG